MPSYFITYNGNDRPLVQYHLPDLQEEFEFACLNQDFNKAAQVIDELMHRKSPKALRYKEKAEAKLDFL